MSKNRRIVAIMFTDIEGYTALMQQDEEKAVTIRNRHREIFESITAAYNGEIIQYFGDGTLSVFNSTVEAVDCGIELQQSFLVDPSIPVRIGIHVGDVVHSKDDIIGDAVNVASRIESCAESGSILISDKVHDQIRSHTHIKTKFLDAYEFKNVDGAIPLFAISNDGLKIPNPKTLKGKFKTPLETESKRKLSTKILFALGGVLLIAALLLSYSKYFDSDPAIKDYSIAVLPFDNLSTDDDAEIFGDGVTEDILTHLSKLQELHVISRTSVMQYKGTKKTIPEIAKELGVAYVLEGSIRKYGEKIRVSAQLIDAETDEHLWADKYDKTITDIFAIQSEVSQEIVDALQLNINHDEKESLKSIPTQNIEAYKLFLRGRKEADKRNKESLTKSIELYKKAIELDPEYAEAYAEIANSTYLETYYSDADPEIASKKAYEYLDKAEKINNKISRIYSVKGLILNTQGTIGQAKTAFKRALQLSPNDLTARHQYATLHYYTKEYEIQLEQAEIAYRLDPLSFATANSYFTALLTNLKYMEAEQLMQKIEVYGKDNNEFVIRRSYFRLYMDMRDFKKAIHYLEMIAPQAGVFNRYLGYCYAKVGDTLKANNIIDTINKVTPKEDKNYQLAVVYAGLQKNDSVFHHLDTVRNIHSDLLKRDRLTIFYYLKDNLKFKEILKMHNLESGE